MSKIWDRFIEWSEWGNEDLTRDYFSFYDIFCVAMFLLPFIIAGVLIFFIIKSVIGW